MADTGNGAPREGDSEHIGLNTTHKIVSAATAARTDVGACTDTSSGVRYGGSVYVQGVEVFPGGKGVRLESHSAVQIGCMIFSFVLPSSKTISLLQESDVRQVEISS